MSCGLAFFGSPPARAAIEAQNIPAPEPQPEPQPAPVLTQAPELVTFVNAVYPVDLLYRGVDGDVVLAIDIDAAGAVERVEVISASEVAFGPAAMTAASQFVFTPAEIDYAPAPIRIEYRYRFEAQTPEPDAIAGEPTWRTAEQTVAEVSITGFIREAGVRNPIAGAVIRVNGQPVTESAADGSFSIRRDRTPAGKLEIKITTPYHRSYKREEELAADERLEINYYLLPTRANPFETIVRTRAARREVSKVRLDRRELEKVPGTSGDPIRVLENLPGLARAPGGLGGSLLVRGANPTDTKVFMDGITIPILYHFGGLTSVINSTMLERIDFYPGGFSARYGAAIAGVVDVVSRDLDCDMVRGNTDVSLIDAELALCVPLGDHWHVAAAGRRSYIDALLPLVLGAVPRDEDDGVLSVSPAYADYQLKAQGRYGAHSLSFFAFGSDDQFRLIQTGSAESINVDFNLQIGFHRVLLRHTFKSEDLTLTTTVSPGVSLFSAVAGAAEIGLSTSFSFTLWEVAVREDVTWKLHETLELRAGFDGTFGSNDFAIDVPIPTDLRRFPSPVFDITTTEELSDQYSVFNHSYWVEAQWQPIEGLQIIPGLRIDRWDFHKTQDSSVLPRFNVRWEFAEGMLVKGAYGIFERLPDIQNLGNRPLGNPALRPLRSDHFIVGYEHSFTDLIHLDVQGYYNQRRNIPSSSNSTKIRDGKVIPKVWSNDGGGDTYGLEILLRHLAVPLGSGSGASILDRFRGRFFGWIAYTLSKSVRWNHTPGSTFTIEQGNGAVIELPYSDRSTRPYNAGFDQTHILTVVGQMILLYGFEIGMRFRLVSGNPYTPREEGSLHWDSDSDSYVNDLSDVDRNSARMPLFHQLDVRVDKTWTFDLWKLTAYIEVLNVYNQSNVESFQYDYRSQEKVPLTLLPVVPVFGVRGEW